MKDQMLSHIQKLSPWYFMGIAITERDIVCERGRCELRLCFSEEKIVRMVRTWQQKAWTSLSNPFSCSDNRLQTPAATSELRNRGSDGVEYGG